MPRLRLALAQTNPIIGDLTHNREAILARCREAAADNADLLVTGEMALVGHPVEDLGSRETFIEASRSAVGDLAEQLHQEGLGDLFVVVGHLGREPSNAFSVLHQGQILARPDTHRTSPEVIRIKNVDVAVAIARDVDLDTTATDAEVLLLLDGSPYSAGLSSERLERCAEVARASDAWLAWVNLAGGQDDLVFDGGSFVVDTSGDLVARAPQFEEALLVVDLEAPAPEGHDSQISQPLDGLAERYGAMVLGLRDYITKNGFSSVLLGMSGGIDSTLVAAIAVDALGPDRVFGVSNPSEWSTEHSMTDAQDQAERLSINLRTIPIAGIFDSFQDSLALTGVAEENLQARIRAVIWMGLANQEGHVVLACGNKSELAAGYSTIYGDAVGGYAPIKDLPKTLVWEVSRWRNRIAEERGDTPPIPQAVIDKLPSAELRPGQLDSDSLPPYDVLDGIIDAYVGRDLSIAAIVAEGFDEAIVRRIAGLVDGAEWKRRQYPPGPQLSKRGFGRDRHVPITHRWHGEP